MKTKPRNLLTIAAMAFVVLNFTSCKEEGETLQEKAERLKGSCSYSINHVSITDNRLIEINSTETHIDTRNITDKNYEVSYDLYLGTSVDNMELIDPQKINTEYFNMYYAQIIEYVTSNNERYDIDTIGVFKLLCMPYGQLYYETHCGAGGDGEFSNSIQVKLFSYDQYDVSLSYLDADFSYDLVLTPGMFINGSFNASDTIESVTYAVSSPDHSILLKGGRYPYADLPAYSVSSNGAVKIIGYKCDAENFKLIVGNDTIERQVLRTSEIEDRPYLHKGDKFFIMCDTANYAYDYDYGLYYKKHIGNKRFVNCKLYNISDKIIDNYETVTNDIMLDIEETYGIEKSSLSDYYIIDNPSAFSGFTNKRKELENKGYVLGGNTDIVADVYSMLANNWEEENNNAIRFELSNVEFDGKDYITYRVVWRGMPGVVRVLEKGSNGYSNFSVQK